MQSSALMAKKIAGQSDSSGDNNSEADSNFEVIKHIDQSDQ